MGRTGPVCVCVLSPPRSVWSPWGGIWQSIPDQITSSTLLDTSHRWRWLIATHAANLASRAMFSAKIRQSDLIVKYARGAHICCVCGCGVCATSNTLLHLWSVLRILTKRTRVVPERGRTRAHPNRERELKPTPHAETERVWSMLIDTLHGHHGPKLDFQPPMRDIYVAFTSAC